MENILKFIETNYLWFLVVAIILLLALIGYFVDVRKSKDDSPFKKTKENKEKTNEEAMANVKIENNMSLNEMINNTVNKPLNAEAKAEPKTEEDQGVNMQV